MGEVALHQGPAPSRGVHRAPVPDLAVHQQDVAGVGLDHDLVGVVGPRVSHAVLRSQARQVRPRHHPRRAVRRVHGLQREEGVAAVDPPRLDPEGEVHVHGLHRPVLARRAHVEGRQLDVLPQQMLRQRQHARVGVDPVEHLALVGEVAQPPVRRLVELLDDADHHLAQLAAPRRGLGVVVGHRPEAPERPQGDGQHLEEPQKPELQHPVQPVEQGELERRRLQVPLAEESPPELPGARTLTLVELVQPRQDRLHLVRREHALQHHVPVLVEVLDLRREPVVAVLAHAAPSTIRRTSARVSSALPSSSTRPSGDSSATHG